jgi:hypothetical protein
MADFKALKEKGNKAYQAKTIDVRLCSLCLLSVCSLMCSGICCTLAVVCSLLFAVFNLISGLC